jgi:hypothetical protein
MLSDILAVQRKALTEPPLAFACTEFPASEDSAGVSELRARGIDGRLLSGDSADAAKGIRVALCEAGSAPWLGTAVVVSADESGFESETNLPVSDLGRCAALSDLLVRESTGPEMLAATLYLALRRARILGYANIVTLADDSAPVWQLLNLVPLRHVAKKAFTAGAQRLDIAIHRAWTASGSLKPALRTLFVAEAVETLDRWIAGFFASSWFRAIHERTMSREQYIYTLSNMYQFVRWTTRLIGRAVSHSEDRELRGHWLKHLDGEINHDLVIENDLAELGADVRYVTDTMVPNVHIQQLLAVQESTIGFHQDPVLFMAPPFVAEGFSARLDKRFMNALNAVVKSWGIPNPRRATMFFEMHINSDGGDDGHWETMRAILGRYLADDGQLQRFLNVARLAMNSFSLSYSSYIEDLAVFTAHPHN